jgi:putative inorganic carbon (hco3(-)) transporter
MGNIILFLYFSALIPLSLLGAHVAIMTYLFFSTLLPQNIIFNSIPFGLTQPYAIIAICLWIVGLQKEHPPKDGIFILFLIFFTWCTLTNFTAVFPDAAWVKWNDFLKTVLAAVIVASVINSRERLHALAWVIVLGFGFHGFKGGVWTVLTGGSGTVLGPGSYFKGENEVARVFLVVVGLCYYLWRQNGTPIGRWIAVAIGSASAVAVIGTGSRGGMVALLAMLAYFALRSPYRLRFLAASAVIATLAVAITPQQRVDLLTARQLSTLDYETDGSFNSRLDAWNYAIKVVSQRPITGGGFNIYFGNIVEGFGQRDSHSSYFEILAEQGFVGFFLWGLLSLWVFLRAWRIERIGSRDPSTFWARDLGFALQLCLIGHFVGGLVKNHGYFQPFYLYVAMVVQLTALVIAARQQTAPASRTEHRERGRRLPQATLS